MVVKDNNKRIAKNTILLYFRMLFSMGISLYTSRVVLGVLGIDDFGIYNVVAGVVVMFSFLSTSMSTATARFLSFELGKKDYLKLTKYFSASLTTHLIIALCVVILSETIGLWFLYDMLVIPIERMYEAKIVYQFAIASTFISVIQVPFIALIMAYEEMRTYAYIEIVNVCLKLGVVFLLLLFPVDKLLLYGGLLLLVSFLIFVIYSIYCIRHLHGSVLRLTCSKKELIPIFKFAGCDFYGNASVLARTQGVNMLLNIFFGTALNAASGVAAQVQGAVMSFAGNVLTAIRPQITKSYAMEDYDRTIMLINKTSLYTFMLLLLFTIPLILETEYILSVWLKEVPKYSVMFCRYTLLFNLFANLSTIVISGIHATGKIKRASFTNGTIYLSVVPLTYIAYRLGFNPATPYLYNVIAVAGGLLSNIWLLEHYIPNFSCRYYFINVLCKCVVCGILLLGINYLLINNLSMGGCRLIYCALLSIITTSFCTYYVVMSKTERIVVKEYLMRYGQKWR